MENQVVFITGAGKGMGEATALLAGDRGAKVVVADVDLQGAQSVVDKIIAKGGEAIAVKCNVASVEEVKAAIDKTVETYGRLDAAFNNAGIQLPDTDITDVTEEDYDRVMDINLKGVWLCMKYQLLQMREQGSGAIVNNSSIGGLIGSAGRAAYHATKHGVLGLTKSAAVAYAPKGIRVNAVCPGTIETPMVEQMIKVGDLPVKETTEWAPIKRFGKASEVAEVVLWLFSPASSYVIGQPISVDGGISIS
ncbi:SDR family NAD(P)-dependent oxidoreductase [Myroides odoratimimus]|uniref:SDR family NAD(P)-dependent oxidoreductase n=1 Tax=Myroides odoratimimus TaxID=76832 RepID=UPI0004A81C4F|nr:SDR family NAD(P)-dependent oxidoreductase [Myroides odoratimimus]